ncbi:MAG: hypothetical protein WDM91_15415 [Rhizomicrobium sp.]
MDAARWRRLSGAAAVALLHAALVWALLVYSHAGRDRPAAAVAEREIIFFFPPPPPHPARPRDRDAASRSAAPTPSAATTYPDFRGITIPDAGGSPALGRSLFGCSPEEKADLSPEMRARCGNGFAFDNSVDIRDGTARSRAAALWERGRERKNAPLLLPCMSPNAPPGLSIGTVICLAKGAIEGFDPNAQPSYADQPGQALHIPNNGNPPDHPD